MSSDATPAPESDADERKPLSLATLAGAALLLLLFGLIMFGALRGCVSEDPQNAASREEEQKKKEEEEKKRREEQEQADPQILPPVVLPQEVTRVEQHVKPGHWAIASQQMTAKFRDFFGRIQTRLTEDQTPTPLPIQGTPYWMRSTRPVALPKETTKNIECAFFVPLSASRLRLITDFEEGGLGAAQQSRAQLVCMLPHQYHFVVLAKEPERYALVKTLDSVQVPYAGESQQDVVFSNQPENIHYYVELQDVSRGIPLPDSALMWTSTAYLLWDEVDPQPFTPAQEQALIDWLHWGGQLIVNGPDSLDLIQGSFLQPYMPATNGGPREISADDLKTFNEHWLISTNRTRGEPLAPAAPWSGINLVPVRSADGDPSPENASSPDPLWESTGGLLAERAVGRGRVVVSAMQLTERELVNWRSGFESWFNACLLRRPPRVYRPGGLGGQTLLWDATSDPSLADRRLDARLTSRLQYFARDLGVETHYRYETISFGDGGAGGRRRFGFSRPSQQATREYRPPPSAGGLGAWNDFSATAQAARQALREAAGVEVPGPMFVVVCLGAYLIILVPLNAMVFQALGRLEWAWIAAPLIAVAGTFAVVHMAQLDIGFVRSQTEIGLLELQPEYPRSHLARYTALYSSLSTTYDLEFDDSTAQALPFPREDTVPAAPSWSGLEDGRRRSGSVGETIDFQRQERVRMTGLPVLSNSTNMVHSEQMFALDGPIRLSPPTPSRRSWQIENL